MNPYEYYGKEFRDKGGWGAWLGTGRVSNWNRVFLTYDEAVQIVHPLKIKNQREWRAYRPKPTIKGGWPGRWHQFERKELTPKSETTTKPAKGLVNAKTQLRSKRLRKRHKVLAPEASSRRLNRCPVRRSHLTFSGGAVMTANRGRLRPLLHELFGGVAA